MTETLHVAALLREVEGVLAERENARLDAEALLAHTLNTTREWLYAHPESAVAPARVSDLFLLARNRRAGVPVAYLTGRREFWSMDFLVNRHTLIPRPETERLVEAALEFAGARQGLEILDLGTGCGALAVALAREQPSWSVTATDISREALEVAAYNMRQLDVPGIECLHSDWTSALGTRRFHLVVCNPPYVDSSDPVLLDSDIRYEPRVALDGGHGGMQCLQIVIHLARRHLLPGGMLVLEHGADQSARVRELLNGSGYVNAGTFTDTAGRDRISFGTWE